MLFRSVDSTLADVTLSIRPESSTMLGWDIRIVPLSRRARLPAFTLRAPRAAAQIATRVAGYRVTSTSETSSSKLYGPRSARTAWMMWGIALDVRGPRSTMPMNSSNDSITLSGRVTS